ncbi:recombinase RecT [Acinetobacter sp. ME22]|uniref:recombinase RecT n=1 Tax=Acinetobacter sp. ME22 TaxID=2904802 RepID=UPI001EDC38D9|nr:recombinase RecT [Acinetobacter sp. ME22]MCG2572279.1 recombinase RecT [Acinetobacter sp. ME22]
MNTEQQHTNQVTPTARLNQFIQKHKAQLELALPKHLNADRMVRLTLTAFSQNKDLQQCDQNSIFASIIIASQLGLEPGVNGQGYLIPYRGKCTFVPGWKGLVDLAQRGGRASVWTGAVYEGDYFDYMLGDSPYCHHRPCGEFDEEKLTHVYAIGRVKDSEMPVIEVWPIRKVHAHFKKTVVAALQPNHYSKKHFEAYAKKVALLQVLKYMPQSIELSTALDVSSANEQGKGITIDGDFITVDNGSDDSSSDVQPQDLDQRVNNEVQPQQAVEEQSQALSVANVNSQDDYHRLKNQILRCKTLDQLDFIEEEVLEVVDLNQRKALVHMVKAQRVNITKTTTVVEDEKDPQSTTKKTRTRKANTQADQVAVEESTVSETTSHSPAREVSAPQKSSDEVRKQYSAELHKAQSLIEVNDFVGQFESDNRLTDQHKFYLHEVVHQCAAKFEQEATAQQPINEIKSRSSRDGIEKMIKDANDLGYLETTVANTISGYKSRLTTQDFQAVTNLYAQRKTLFSQQNMFEANQSENLPFVDSMILKIQHAKSVDELVVIITDPDVTRANDKRINDAYDSRLAELKD